MEPRVAGNPEPIEMGIQSVLRRTGPNDYERRWWGVASAIHALANGTAPSHDGRTPPPGFLGNPIEVSVTQSPGSAIAILTARYNGTPNQAGGDPELATETMEIDFKDETFPLHRNPTFVDIPSSTIQDVEDAIKAHTEDILDGIPTTDPLYRYFKLRQRGEESYKTKLPYVTWTRTVGEGYSAELDIANTGAIFSTGDLANSIGAPVLFEIPTGNVGVDRGTLQLYSEGWMKGAQLTYSSDGRIQMILTAEFGLWSNDAYVFV